MRPAPVVYRIINEEPRLDGVPVDLRELVGQCLAKSPADRPGVKEILDRLGTRATDPTANAPTTMPPADRPVTAEPTTMPPADRPVTAERPTTPRLPHHQPATAPTATPTRTPPEDGGAGPVDPAQTPAPTRSTDRTVRLWDVATRRNTATFGDKRDAERVAFSPDGKTLARSCPAVKKVRLWKVR